MGYCDGLSKSGTAFKICNVLENDLGLKVQEVDTGTCFVKHKSKEKNPSLYCSKPDGKVSANEVFSAAIKLAEMQSPQKTNILEVLAAQGITLPWLGYATRGASADEAFFFQRIKSDAKLILKAADSITNKTKATSKEHRLAMAVMDYIVRPVSNGGLGMKFDFVQVHNKQTSERTIYETASSRTATCTEFVSLFLFIAGAVGLKAEPVQIFENQFHNPITHVGAGVKTPEGDLVFDLAYSANNYLHSVGRWSYISKNDFLAYVLMNRSQSLRLCGNHNEDADRLLDLASEVAPQNYLVLQALGRREADAGNYFSAETYLNASAVKNPFSADTFWLLQMVYGLSGSHKKAKEACQKYKLLGGEMECK